MKQSKFPRKQWEETFCSASGYPAHYCKNGTNGKSGKTLTI